MDTIPDRGENRKVIESPAKMRLGLGCFHSTFIRSEIAKLDDLLAPPELG